MKTSVLDIPKEILSRVPAKIALHYTVCPFALEKNSLRLLVPLDFSRESRDELKVALGGKLEFVHTPQSEILEILQKFYGIGAGTIETLTQSQTQVEEQEDTVILDSEAQDDPTISALVNELFVEALKCRASDIHVEPFEKSLRIRYRVDGLLQEAKVSEQIRMLALNLISRIKIMAKLDIGEKRLPQDGRIKIKRKSEELDLRVSVVPSSFGEAVVIRILKPLQLLSLQDLGFEEDHILQMRSFLKKPHGVILITGPTGSGKTTTLYACLRELNQIHRKIITVEDPVEYKLPGIIQMQVNSKIKFDFAKALRSILRHDPDCIMIGEIRDAETAEIAIRASLTGHLVFSTLHTNDAPSAVTRLVEMGIEPYLAASSLIGVIAQRLVRKICECRMKVENLVSNTCSRCSGSGFYGRLAIAEIMPVEDLIRDLILERKTGSQIRKAAMTRQMRSLHEDGMMKVRLGLTNADEVERIVTL